MARPEALQRSLASMDVSDPHFYQDDTWRPLFAQLRREDPVHYCESSPFGPYWSVTRYDDIFAVELDHETYSSASELGGISSMRINQRRPFASQLRRQDWPALVRTSGGTPRSKSFLRIRGRFDLVRSRTRRGNSCE